MHNFMQNVFFLTTQIPKIISKSPYAITALFLKSSTKDKLIINPIVNTEFLLLFSSIIMKRHIDKITNPQNKTSFVTLIEKTLFNGQNANQINDSENKTFERVKTSTHRQASPNIPAIITIWIME